jgi:CRP-like cAMP-binding protein
LFKPLAKKSKMEPHFLPFFNSNQLNQTEKSCFESRTHMKPILREDTFSSCFENFRRCIEAYAVSPLTYQQFTTIKEVMRVKKFKKRQNFLKEGEVCKYFGFIAKGAMRQYSIDDNGVEYMVHLSLENSWVGDRESWVMLTPTIYTIDAWEDTEMILITKADSVRLVREIPAFDEMLRKMDESLVIDIQKRVNAAISLPAHQRYFDFANNYPELIQRFPQHIIASYLGVSKETLSRVRKFKLMKH